MRLEEIEAARTPAGGWTKDQLAQWGVPWPPPKGWKRKLAEGRAKAIYFIGAPSLGMVKIGHSADVATRLRDVRRHSPVPLVLLAALPVEGDDSPRARRQQMAIERRFHERHFDARVHDEWFRLTPELRADIEAVRAGSFDVEALPPPTIRTWRGGCIKCAGGLT